MTPHYPHSRRPRLGKATVVVTALIIAFLCLCGAGLFLSALSR